jgi:hypothetical protein
LEQSRRRRRRIVAGVAMKGRDRLRASSWLLAAAAVAWPGRVTSSAEPPPAAAPPVQLHVPRVSARVRINAETEGKPYWGNDDGVTRNFLDDHQQGMVPFTQAKVRWGRGFLYLLLYAGDLDLEGHIKQRDGAIESDDAFHLEFGKGNEVRVISVSVLGTIADALCASSPGGGRRCVAAWDSGATVAVDRDGSLNKVGDNDEEWVVEMSIPLAKLGLKAPAAGTRIPFSIRRCEIGHDGRHACGSWGVTPPGELVLDP